MNEITEDIKQKIYELYDECLSSTEQFHRKLDLFIVPAELISERHTICQAVENSITN